MFNCSPILLRIIDIRAKSNPGGNRINSNLYCKLKNIGIFKKRKRGTRGGTKCKNNFNRNKCFQCNYKIPGLGCNFTNLIYINDKIINDTITKYSSLIVYHVLSLLEEQDFPMQILLKLTFLTKNTISVHLLSHGILSLMTEATPANYILKECVRKTSIGGGTGKIKII